MSTLSLADVARLAQVSRPVVSVWRKRPKGGVHFPPATADGRFPAEDVLDWLERTQRGNNPHARRDLAIAVACSAQSEGNLNDLLVMLAAKAATGLTMASADPADLLDAIDALDPDDEWILSDLEAVDIAALAADTDAVTDAAWSVADAYETLLDTMRTRSASANLPGAATVAHLAALARLLRSEQGVFVDVAGTADDVVLTVATEDDPELPVLLPVTVDGARAARRRYRVHGVRPRLTSMDDDWALPDGSVVLAVLPHDPDTALGVLEEVAVQLAGTSVALVVGPAAVLVDELPPVWETRRDGFLRDPARTLAAVVRLPQGLDHSGGRQHLALWLLRRDASEVTRVADLAGRRVCRALWEQLLDDLFAVASSVRSRAFAVLRPVPTATLLAGGGSLVHHGGEVTDEWVPSPGDDAARMQHLLDDLAAALPNPLEGVAPWAQAARRARHISLGEASRSGQVTLIPGTRMTTIATGVTPVWTAESLTTGAPASLDLFALTAAHPHAPLTQPGDVVFVTGGKPRALVDTVGGAAVAYPARVIRVPAGQPHSPHAIASAINAVDAGNNAWRTWQIPVPAGDAAEADRALARVDELAALLRHRQTQVEELRRLVVRSVLPGSVAFHETRSDPAKGE